MSEDSQNKPKKRGHIKGLSYQVAPDLGLGVATVEQIQTKGPKYQPYNFDPLGSKQDGEVPQLTPEEQVPRSGMGVIVTGLIIIGEMAGGGIVAMPEAMKYSSWGGIGLILIGALMSSYTGVQLGWSWTILQEEWPRYKAHTRKPYPEIARRAVGNWMKHVVSVCITVSLFGISVVFLILGSEILQNLINTWASKSISFCYLMLILAVVLLPLTFLKSPKDFWPAIVTAMCSTALAFVFIMIGIGMDRHEHDDADFPPITFKTFFLAFATILFAYGGHGAFPTIQHDMKEPHKFHISVGFAYLVIVILYLPVSIGGYLVYKGTVGSNAIESLGTEWIRLAVNFLIAMHVILSFIIISNPVNQEIEQLFRIPQRFTWKRLVSRSAVMVLVVFCAESIPHFGAVLDLIAACTTTFLTFVFPGIFYVMLVHRYRRAPGRTKWYAPLPWWQMLINFIIISVGLLGGVAATYAAISGIIHPPNGRVFSVPCYINKTAAG